MRTVARRSDGNNPIYPTYRNRYESEAVKAVRVADKLAAGNTVTPEEQAYLTEFRASDPQRYEWAKKRKELSETTGVRNHTFPLELTAAQIDAIERRFALTRMARWEYINTFNELRKDGFFPEKMEEPTAPEKPNVGRRPAKKDFDTAADHAAAVEVWQQEKAEAERNYAEAKEAYAVAKAEYAEYKTIMKAKWSECWDMCRNSTRLSELAKRAPHFADVGAAACILQAEAANVNETYRRKFTLHPGSRKGWPKPRGKDDDQWLKYIISLGSYVRVPHGCNWGFIGIPGITWEGTKKTLGELRFRAHDTRGINWDNVSSVQIIRRGGRHNPRYVATFTIREEPLRQWPEVDPNSACGIDVGLSHIITLVDNSGRRFQISNPRWYYKMERRLAFEQRRLFRMTGPYNQETRKSQVESKNWVKQKSKVAKLQLDVAQARKTVLEQIASWIVANYQTIGVESLNVAGMTQNKHLAKSVMSTGMSTFLTALSSRAADAGRNLVEAPRMYPSTKVSCLDGATHEQSPAGKAGLRIRHWNHGDTELDRDYNAAVNLMSYALHPDDTEVGRLPQTDMLGMELRRKLAAYRDEDATDKDYGSLEPARFGVWGLPEPGDDEDKRADREDLTIQVTAADIEAAIAAEEAEEARRAERDAKREKEDGAPLPDAATL